jgi:hypothetical protein
LFEAAVRIAECLGGVETANANPAFSEGFPHPRNIYVRCILGNAELGYVAISVGLRWKYQC